MLHQCLSACCYLASGCSQLSLWVNLGESQDTPCARPCIHVQHAHRVVQVWSGALLCDLTPCCLCLVRFDYCRFIELDYVPMETGYMVSMRPTKGYTSTKSPTKGYTSTKSPDRHSRPTNSPSTPRSRSVLSPSSSSSFLLFSVDSLKHGNDPDPLSLSWMCHDVALWETFKTEQFP